MAQQQSGAYGVKVEGLTDALSKLNRAEAHILGLDVSELRLANSMLRAAARQLADEAARDTLAPMVSAYGGPQGPALADTLRPKVDRIPIVRVGAVNPKLRGPRTEAGYVHTFAKRSRKHPRTSSGHPVRSSMAWGVEFGPKQSGAKNPYGRPRSARGYIFGPRTDDLERRLSLPYRRLLAAAFESAGVRVKDVA